MTKWNGGTTTKSNGYGIEVRKTRMAASNAERQAKWRQRQKQRIAELKAQVAKLARGTRRKRRRQRAVT